MQRASALRGPRSAHAAPRREALSGGGPPLRQLSLPEALLTLSPDGVATLTAAGALNLWSAAAERLTGRSRLQARRLGLLALLQDPRQGALLLERAETGRRPVSAEVSLLDAAGRPVPVRLHALALATGPSSAAARAPRGEEAADPDAVLLVLQDLSEVHTIRRRLIETEKLSAMAKIAGSVAHEFRNPLNSLFLSADLLEDELAGSGALGSSIAPTLTAIREEVERLNQIITHYLALSKIASSERERVDVGRLADEFASEWRSKAAERGALLRVRTEGAPGQVLGDVNQLRRVLVNLVENALDAVSAPRPGGEPRVRSGTVTLGVRRMRRAVRLVVQDDGDGLPASVRERVFEPFTTTKAGGTGLGLYLVREMVLAHGGTIALSSTPGRGTRVAIRLPAVGAPRRAQAEGGR